MYTDSPVVVVCPSHLLKLFASKLSEKIIDEDGGGGFGVGVGVGVGCGDGDGVGVGVGVGAGVVPKRSSILPVWGYMVTLPLIVWPSGVR